MHSTRNGDELYSSDSAPLENYHKAHCMHIYRNNHLDEHADTFYLYRHSAEDSYKDDWMCCYRDCASALCCPRALSGYCGSSFAISNSDPGDLPRRGLHSCWALRRRSLFNGLIIRG